MSVRLIFACDGAWDSGRFPCRSFLPLELAPLEEAKTRARVKGWTVDDEVLCPACTAKEERRAHA